MLKLPVVGDQVPRRHDPFLRWLGTSILRNRGWTVHGELPNVPKLVVIAVPHTSNWDGLFAMSFVQAAQIRLSTMGKDSLFKNPLIGRFLRWLGLFPIDRSAPNGVVGQSIERLQAADKLWLMMAPEGTRGGADEWKTGFYRIASGAGVPIFSAALDYAKKQVVLMELFHPTGDLEADVQTLIRRFVDIEPRRPERLSGPLKALRQDKN
mgnify:CR=1 FL=1